MAPPVGLEPTTLRLTAACSAIELQGNQCLIEYINPVLYVQSTFYWGAFPTRSPTHFESGDKGPPDPMPKPVP